MATSENYQFVGYYEGAPELNEFEDIDVPDALADDFEDLASIIREAGGQMNIGDLLDQIKETAGPEAMGSALMRLYVMGEAHQVMMNDDANVGRLTVTLRDKPREPFSTDKWVQSFKVTEQDDEYELADEFDSQLPSNPKPADWHEVARLTGNMRILRNRKKMQQLANEVDKLRFERRIRRHIYTILENSGGVAGIEAIRTRVESMDGQAGGNAAMSLIHIMQAEGKLRINIPDWPKDPAHEDKSTKVITVRLLRKRH